MHKRICSLISLCFVALPLSSTAQFLSTSIESGLLRSALPKPGPSDDPSAPSLKILVAGQEQPKLKWKGRLGAAHTDPDIGTNALTTPFQLKAQLGLTDFSVEGDGYKRLSGGASGLTDPTFIASRTFIHGAGKAAFIAGAGVTVPMGGPVGGDDVAERLIGIYAYEFNPVYSLVGIAVLLHLEGDVSAGLSRYVQVGGFQAKKNFGADKKSSVYIQFIGIRRGGGGTITELTGAYDFPLAPGYSGTLLIARGLKSSAEYTKVQFDVSFSR